MQGIFNASLGKIEYNDDETYRGSICKIFEIDETEFDNFSFEPAFDMIYDKTKEDPFFKKVYTIAAGFMLSEDPSIGVCVLFAYDYAKAFYEVLCDYLNDATSEGSDSYFATNRATLEKLLERK
jgi:hypothetical protein